MTARYISRSILSLTRTNRGNSILIALLLLIVIISISITFLRKKPLPKPSNIIKDKPINAKTPLLSCNNTIGQCYKNPKILSQSCSLTILFLEPRISKAPPKSDIYYALESIASNVIPFETTCVLIQTSFHCPYISPKDLYDRIRSNAMEHLRSLMDMGNVRVVSLEEQFYNVEHCHWNVNRLFMHPLYWSREFVSQDSDHVLVLQSDSVVCRTLNITQWNDFAYGKLFLSHP